MKRSIADGLLSVGSVIMVVGIMFYFFPIRTDQNEDWNVQALREFTATKNCDQGHRTEAYFTIRGGNEQLRFWIKDPYGATIYDAGTVTGRLDFAFTAEHTGAYTLYFFNAQTASKTVYFTEKNDAASIGVIIALVGFLIMLPGLASIMQNWARVKQSEMLRNKQPTPQP